MDDEGCVDQVRVVPVPPGDRVLEPLVVPLGRQAQDPARHRDRHPDTGTGRGQGGAGLGAAWGHQLAVAMLQNAGFSAVDVRELDEDPLNYYYLARTT